MNPSTLFNTSLFGVRKDLSANLVKSFMLSGSNPVLDPNTAPLIYVGIRNDGQIGSGTLTDPYDGSTQSHFESLFNNLPASCHVIILPGTYNISRVFMQSAVTGGTKWIQGSGIGITIIKKIDINTNVVDIYQAPLQHYDDTASIKVSDLTIDSNNRGQTYTNTLSLPALSLACLHGEVENVECLDCYGGGGGESFFVCVFNSSPVDATCSIRNVTLKTAGGIATGICAFNQYNASLGGGTMTGIIDSCKVIDAPGVMAFGPPSSRQRADNFTGAGLVINCMVINAQVVSGDTGNNLNCAYKNCYFDISDTAWGILIGGGGNTYENFLIEDCTFITGDGAPPLVFSDHTSSAAFLGVHIHNCKFLRRKGSVNTTRPLVGWANGASDASIIMTDNWADESFTCVPIASAIKLDRNYYLQTGNPIPNICPSYRLIDG